jgi:ABC-type nitrate/sulfonate/bicarbonate transport system ATPase subunit
VIEILNLHYSYDHAQPIFAGHDVRIAEKGVYSLFGRSGCGKSTLGKIVSGLLAPTSIESINVHGPRLYASDDDVLPPWKTVGTHLSEVIPCERQSELDAYLAAASLDPSLLSRRPSELSHGQRQRFNLARFLFQDFGTLVLDEIMSKVDQPTRWSILDHLRVHNSETILYISHEVDDVLLFSDIVYKMAMTTPTSMHEVSKRITKDTWDVSAEAYKAARDALLA